MDVPKQTQLYIDSLEPRWFYGVKSFSETSIGAVPGALVNAIYNACGVRIREHPITREKIMAGLKAQRRQSMKNVSIYRPTTVDEAIQILSQPRDRSRSLCRRHRSADPPEEPPAAGAHLFGRHQENRQPALHQRGRRRQRAHRHRHQTVRDGRLRPAARRNTRCWSRPSTRSPRRSCATHRRSAATCCRKSGASICAAAIPAGATAATSATEPSATTATTIPRWAAVCVTPSIPATPRRR